MAKQVPNLVVVPAKKPKPICHKEFLYPEKDVVDDSFIATGIIPIDHLHAAAGFSFYDGEHSVAFRFKVGQGPSGSDAMKKFDRTIDKIVARLAELKATTHKLVDGKKA